MKRYIVGIVAALLVACVVVILLALGWAQQLLVFLKPYAELLQPFSGLVSILTLVGYIVMHLDTRRQGEEQRKHAADQEERHRQHASSLESMRVENERALHELRTGQERQKELDSQLRAALAEHYANMSAVCRAKLSLIHAAHRAKFPQSDFDRNEGWTRVKELARELKKANIKMKNAMHDLLYLPQEVIDETAGGAGSPGGSRRGPDPCIGDHARCRRGRAGPTARSSP